MKLSRIGIVVALGMTVAACGMSKYYVVKSQFRLNAVEEEAPNVTEGRDFRSAFNTIRTLAVQAPDNCSNATQSENTGRASRRGRGTGRVMTTNCGVEMAQIETALARAGYNVISWKILENSMKAAMQTSKSNLDAAKELGADALFQINSLERTRSEAGKDARWDRRFYTADKNLGKQKPTEVKANIAGALNNLAKRNELQAISASRVPSATANASVTLAENGRAIWFYTWTHRAPLTTSEFIETETPVQCTDGVFCSPYTPGANNNQRNLYGGSSEAVSSGGSAEDRLAALQDKLMKEVLADMISRFKL